MLLWKRRPESSVRTGRAFRLVSLAEVSESGRPLTRLYRHGERIALVPSCPSVNHDSNLGFDLSAQEREVSAPALSSAQIADPREQLTSTCPSSHGSVLQNPHNQSATSLVNSSKGSTLKMLGSSGDPPADAVLIVDGGAGAGAAAAAGAGGGGMEARRAGGGGGGDEGCDDDAE